MTSSDEARKRGLGRGLSSLLGDDEESVTAAQTQPVSRLSIDLLLPSPWQPRQVFNQEAMDSLVASVRERGVIQPILVRPSPEHAGFYQIVAGERRWRAAQTAHVHDVPVVVRSLSDSEALELALIENIQRADLSAMEEARAYRRLMDEFHHTQEVLAQSLGKSRSHIANMLRLLTLPAAVQKLIEQGKLSYGHARALITASDPTALAERVVAQDLSVRETEKLAQNMKQGGEQAEREENEEGGQPNAHPLTRSKLNGKNAASAHNDADRAALERDLSALLGLKVVIDHKGMGGKISVFYGNLDQLDSIIARLNAAP